MNKKLTPTKAGNDRRLRQYYRFQSHIYDLTRWSFLFGRNRIIRKIPYRREKQLRILEVGCGTGQNLVALARRFPNAKITGIDLSPDMLHIARKKTAAFSDRITIVAGAFGLDAFEEAFDLILFSYCLTMVNPGWKTMISDAKLLTRAGGYVAVVDFYNSPWRWFKRHMAGHHVRMDAHLLLELSLHFKLRKARVHRAYGGVWCWFYFVGRG